MSIEEQIRQLIGESVDASLRAIISRIERLELMSYSLDENALLLVYNSWLKCQPKFPTPLEAFREGWKAAMQKK